MLQRIDCVVSMRSGGKMPSVVLLSIVLACFGDANAETFFVASDGSNLSNAGTPAMPWGTIQFGVDQLAPGDTLIVRAGSYAETVLISGADDSGLPNQRVSIQGEAGAVIDGSTLFPAGRQGLITLRDVSFVTIEGFELARFQTAAGTEIGDTPVGLLIEGDSDNLVIRNNVIHSIFNRSTCGQSSCGVGANGIGIYGTTPAGISDLTLVGNEVRNCMLAASEAFTLNGNISRVLVQDNYIHDNNNIGLDFIGFEADTCRSCSAAQNRVRLAYVADNRSINNSINLSIDGIGSNPWYEGDDGSAGGFYVDGGQFIYFDRNIASQNDLGFEFASEMPGRSSEDIVMVNNLIYSNREVGLAVGGYASSTSGEGGGSAERLRVFNNSFWRNRGWGTEVVFQFRVRDIQLVNNILQGVDSVSDNHYRESNGQYGVIRWSNNLWWAQSTADLSGVQDNGPVADPGMLNPASGNLNLAAGSAAIDAGDLEPGPRGWDDPFWQQVFSSGAVPAHGLLDVNGEARLEGLIDIGADERGSTAPSVVFLDGFEQ